MYMSSMPPPSNGRLSWATTRSGSRLPRRHMRTSAESLAVKSAAGIPLPTTSPTAIAQRVAFDSSSPASQAIGMNP